MAETNYENIDNGYDDGLNRAGDVSVSEDLSKTGTESADNQGEGKDVGGYAFTDMWIETWIKSRTYSPKKRGFYLDGKTGYAEFMDIYVKGSIVGGSLDIPDKTTSNSTHIDSSGNQWWGANTASGYASANAYILSTGAASFSSVLINGRAGTALAAAINADANLITNVINSYLNTATQRILGEFQFQDSGAIAIRTDASNGMWLSPTGMLGKAGGITTFSIDILGNVTLRGAITATSGQIGGFTITATKLYGGYIASDAGTYPKALLDTNGLTVHGTTMTIKDTSGNTRLQFQPQPFGCGMYVLGSTGTIAMLSNVGSGSIIVPNTTNSYDLGSSSQQWRAIYIQGNGTTGTKVMTDSGGDTTTFQTVYVNINGILYRLLRAE